MDKLAKLFKDSNKRLIEKVNDDEYIVSNTIVLVRMDAKGFGQFYAKFNSYKRVEKIPFNFDGGIFSTDNEEFEEDTNMNLSSILNANPKEKAIMSNFVQIIDSKNNIEFRMFKADGHLLQLDRKYEFLLELGDDYRCSGKHMPFLIDKKVAIMPISKRDNSLEEAIKELIV